MKNVFKLVGNQKIITVNKSACDRNHKYSTTSWEAEELAAQNLSAGAFKLWRYFIRNKDNYTFALSSAAAKNDFGIKIDQYNKAVRELIDKEYLISRENHYYIFYDKPPVKKT